MNGEGKWQPTCDACRHLQDSRTDGGKPNDESGYVQGDDVDDEEEEHQESQEKGKA